MLTGPPPKFHGTRDILQVRTTPCGYGRIPACPLDNLDSISARIHGSVTAVGVP